jgi:hypothetical protein
MKFFLSVRGDVQDAWYGLVLVDLDKKALRGIIELKELYQMVKSKAPSLHEMRFLDAVPFTFYEDAAIDLVLNEEEQEKFEGDEYLVLPKERDLEKLGSPARTELDALVLSDESISFRAFPKHADFSIASTEVMFDQLVEWSKADG